MEKSLFLFFTLLTFVACKQSVVEDTMPKATISGEWRYVGTFSKTVDYKCYLCPDFDYEKSIYRYTFNDDKSFNARVNLLIIKGVFNFQETTNDYTSLKTLNLFRTNGTFKLGDWKLLNLPPQTEQDSNFLQQLDTTKNYSITTTTGSQLYDELDLDGGGIFIKFVRKR